MAFALEQFLAAFHLGVASILDLEPRCPLRLRDVRPRAVLRHNPFHIQFADALKQRSAMMLDVFDVAHSRFWDFGQQTPQFVLAIRTPSVGGIAK